jgi:hypothetical protein
LKHVKVSDFGGRTLGSIASTQIFHEPPINEAIPIREWWKTSPQVISMSNQKTRSGAVGGDNVDGKQDLPWKTCQQIKDEFLGRDSAVTFRLRGMVANVRSEGTLWYVILFLFTLFIYLFFCVCF